MAEGKRNRGARERLPGPVRGALWMTAGAFWLSALNVLIRSQAGTMHPFEIAFFRCFFGLVFMLPWILRHGLGVLRTTRPWLHTIRGLCALGTMLSWITALTVVPVAEATALNFVAPLLTTIGGALVLGEVVRIRRWTAIGVGFLGVLIILRPGTQALQPGALLPLVAAGFMATSFLIIRRLSATESTSSIVTYMVLFLTPSTLLAALPFWTWPTPGQLGIFVLMGLFGTLGHWCMTRALGSADASAVMPFDYMRMPFVVLIGFFLLGELPDLWTLVGAIVIIGSAIYVAHREHKLRRAARGGR